MSVTVAQQSHAPLGTLTSASFSGGSSRLVGGAEPAAYLAAISPSDHLSSALYNRDHSSPVDSPAYPCGNSDQRETAANAGASPESPSSRPFTNSLTSNVQNTNNGATSKMEFSNMSLSEPKTFASIPRRDTGASSLQNTSTISGAAGLSDDSDKDKFDLESFMRDFPKSTISFPERVPIPEFTHRFDDLIKSSSISNSAYQQPVAPEPEPRAEVTSSANENPCDKTQETINKDCDDGSGDKAEQESDEDKTLLNSQLALRLKSSIRSEFLSKELFPSSKSETSTRTIDEIMREYGIESSGGSQAYKQSQFLSSVSGTINVSGNNESVKPLEPFNLSRLGSTTSNAVLTEKPHAMQNPPNASEDFIAKSVSTEKFSSGITQLRSVNFSQNNETDTGTQQQDDTRSFGTCVDMTLSALASKYQSTSRTASSYNTTLDRSAPFSGDISFQASNDYKMYDSQAPKATTSYSKYSSSEFGKDGASTGLGNELTGSYSPTRSNNFRLYSQLGAADALGFSLQAEKERLRNLNAVISTTPLSTRYSDLKPYKFTASNSFIASDFESKRHYSTPSLGATTTYPYRNEINSRVGWSAGVPQSTMGKSVSAPTYEYNRGVTSKGSSVDAQYYASRDGGSGRNYQYNNCTYMDKAMADKMLNVRDATASLKKKADHGFKPSPKASSPSVGRGSPTRIALARPISANNVKICKQSTTGKKQIGTASAPRACVVAGRKKINTNESRMMHMDAFSELDFVNDMSKMWQRSMQNMEPKRNPKPQKYQPYKPVSVDDKKMQDRSGPTADHGCINNHKLSDKSRNSWSMSYEPDNSSLLDMESSMAKWGSSVAHGQNKTAPKRQNSVSGTKSYTAASYTSQQPKSILKNMCSKSALTRSSTTITQSRIGPKSYTATSTKAYPVTTAQMFAGLAFKKKAQNNLSSASSSKPKSVKKRSKTPLA